MHPSRYLFLISILLTLTQAVDAQRKWDNKLYSKITDATFRNHKLFNSPIKLDKIDYPRLNAAVFYVSNEARLEQGLNELEYQANLEIMAWNHSKSMGKKDFFAHFNEKEKKRKTPEDRARLAGIKNPRIGENLSSTGGYSYASYLELADSIVDGWIDSPPHRKTLYSKGAIQLGCGVYYYKGIWQEHKAINKQGNGFWLATQNLQLQSKVKAGKSKDKGPS
jgi:uncharacterized protein YkwD